MPSLFLKVKFLKTSESWFLKLNLIPSKEYKCNLCAILSNERLSECDVSGLKNFKSFKSKSLNLLCVVFLQNECWLEQNPLLNRNQISMHRISIPAFHFFGAF